MKARERQVGEAPPTAQACARQLLEVVPQAMRLLREEMRSGIGLGLSVPQFRVLAFLSRHSGASLGAVAEFIGIAAPTASTMVERLVRRDLVARRTDSKERRRVVLKLTKSGAALLERSRTRTRARVTERLEALTGAQLSSLSEACGLLERILGATPAGGERS